MSARVRLVSSFKDRLSSGKWLLAKIDRIYDRAAPMISRPLLLRRNCFDKLLSPFLWIKHASKTWTPSNPNILKTSIPFVKSSFSINRIFFLTFAPVVKPLRWQLKDNERANRIQQVIRRFLFDLVGMMSLDRNQLKETNIN